MRFQFDYNDYHDESTKNKSLALLETFLNFHLLEQFHGWTYECMFIIFRNNAPENKRETVKRIQNLYAKAVVNGNFRENRNYNLGDFEHGLTLIRHAVELVDQLVPEEKDFDAQKLIRGLENLEPLIPKTEEELLDLSKQAQTMESSLPVKIVNGQINASRQRPLPKTTRLVGIRTIGDVGNSLMPYSYIYSEIFGTLLRNERILTPHYKEIYFSIYRTEEEAKMKSPFAYREWHKYTYAALDIDQYAASSEKVKERMVLQCLCDGLRSIAEIDQLDRDKIEKVISKVTKERMNIVLTYKTEENRNYRAEVIYKMQAEQRIPFYLLLTEKATGKSNINFIDNFDPWGKPYSFGKISIKKNEVIIKGGGGLRGEVSRLIEKLPGERRFRINEVLNGPTPLDSPVLPRDRWN
jgi:hypothetical protein